MLTVRQVGDRSVNVHQEVDIVDPQTPFPRCYPARRFIEVNVRSAVPRRGLGNMAVSVHRQPLSLAHRHRGRVALRFTENEERPETTGSRRR